MLISFPLGPLIVTHFDELRKVFLSGNCYTFSAVPQLFLSEIFFQNCSQTAKHTPSGPIWQGHDKRSRASSTRHFSTTRLQAGTVWQLNKATGLKEGWILLHNHTQLIWIRMFLSNHVVNLPSCS